MRPRFPRRLRGLAWVLGVGVLAALAGAALRPSQSRSPADAATAVRTWVWLYSSAHDASVVPVYRGLLGSLPADADILVAVPGAEDEGDCRLALGSAARDARLRFLHTGGPISPWARDLFIPFEKRGRTLVHVPPAGVSSPTEQGASEILQALKQRNPRIRGVFSGTRLEGGDVLLTDRHVIVGHTTIERNLRAFGGDRMRLAKQIGGAFGRKLLVVGRSAATLPYDRIDMFLTALDGSTLLLGDPRLADDVFTSGERGCEELEIADLGRFVRAHQTARTPVYDAIADDLAAAGYRVVRVPILHAESISPQVRGALVNWNNAVIDRDATGAAVAFVPHYRVPMLDQRAHAVWRGLGYRVIPIDTRVAITRGGAVGSLTNGIRATPHADG